MPATPRKIVVGSALTGLILTAGCAGGSSTGAAPTKTTGAPASVVTAASLPSMAAPCIDDDERALGVHFPAAGESLEGIVLGTGTTGIVLAHQADGDLCQWKPYAYALSRRGYRVLTYTSGLHTKAGVVAAAAELRTKGVTRILLVGASKGGTAVLAAAPDIHPPVLAVVDLSGPTSIDDVDASAAVTHLTAPILFMASTLDTPFVTDTKTMYKAATHSVGRKLVLVPGDDHGIALVEYNAPTIEAFLHRYAQGS